MINLPIPDSSFSVITDVSFYLPSFTPHLTKFDWEKTIIIVSEFSNRPFLPFKKCCLFISKGIHLPLGRQEFLLFLVPLLVLIWTDSLWQHCCACSHHVWSCCLLHSLISSPLSFCWSPICLLLSLIGTILPPLQRGLFVEPRDRRRLARWRTSLRGSNIHLGLWSHSTNAHSPQRAVSQHASTCISAHRQSQTFFFFSFPLNFLCYTSDLTSFHFPFPQVLPVLPRFLCQLMSTKMTSPPRRLINMVFSNCKAFLHCPGSQVTNYWVTSQLWARPLTTAPITPR